jgi:hypothetical protein
MRYNRKLIADFTEFCLPYLYSKDNDPAYPVLREVQRMRGLSLKECTWHNWLYLIWYNLGSAEEIFSNNTKPIDRVSLMSLNLNVLPTGTERRGVRGVNGLNIAKVLLDHYFQVEVITLETLMHKSWWYLFESIQNIPYCGTWAAYKWCDLCKNVLCLDICADDIGMGGKGKNAGPVPGMVQLTGESWKSCALNIDLQRELYNYLVLRKSIPFKGLEEMETALCDFNSLTHGRYYVGHDIDKQQEDIKGLPLLYWKAREHVFPGSFLGEKNGWSGVRKHLCTLYRDNGIIFKGGKE